jgi:hypothetical protein
MKGARSKVMDTIAGMAAGLCASGSIDKCDASKLTKQIENLNMFPELVRMTCSMFGAWGAATPNNGLVQLRTLDFGTGPWANYSIVHVHHPDDGNPFVTLSFPGFVGAVTGFSGKIAISEKVLNTTTHNSTTHRIPFSIGRLLFCACYPPPPPPPRRHFLLSSLLIL